MLLLKGIFECLEVFYIKKPQKVLKGGFKKEGFGRCAFISETGVGWYICRMLPPQKTYHCQQNSQRTLPYYNRHGA